MNSIRIEEVDIRVASRKFLCRRPGSGALCCGRSGVKGHIIVVVQGILEAHHTMRSTYVSHLHCVDQTTAWGHQIWGIAKQLGWDRYPPYKEIVSPPEMDDNGRSRQPFKLPSGQLDSTVYLVHVPGDGHCAAHALAKAGVHGADSAQAILRKTAAYYEVRTILNVVQFCNVHWCGIVASARRRVVFLYDPLMRKSFQDRLRSIWHMYLAERLPGGEQYKVVHVRPFVKSCDDLLWWANHPDLYKYANKQVDSWNCGVYVLQWFESVLWEMSGGPQRLEPRHLPMMRLYYMAMICGYVRSPMYVNHPNEYTVSARCERLIMTILPSSNRCSTQRSTAPTASRNDQRCSTCLRTAYNANRAPHRRCWSLSAERHCAYCHRARAIGHHIACRPAPQLLNRICPAPKCRL